MRRKTLRVVALVALVLGIASCGSRGGRMTASESEQDSLQDVPVDSQETVMPTDYEERVEELSGPTQRTEAFSDFFFSFLNDRRFQADRVKFPLHLTNVKGEKRTITRGSDFREYFAWPNADEYMLLLSNEAQMEHFQNAMDLTEIEVQVIDLKRLTIKGFDFSRAEKQWKLLEGREYIPHGVYYDFLRFYQRFSTDNDFQTQSLARPLVYTMPDPDDERGEITGTLDPEQWPAFRPDLPRDVVSNILFGQNLEQTRQITLVHCGIASGLLDVFTFRLVGERWQLVSFKS